MSSKKGISPIGADKWQLRQPLSPMLSGEAIRYWLNFPRSLSIHINILIFWSFNYYCLLFIFILISLWNLEVMISRVGGIVLFEFL